MMSRVMASSSVGSVRVTSVGEGREGLSTGGGGRGSAVSGDGLRVTFCVVKWGRSDEIPRSCDRVEMCLWQDPARWERFKERRTYPSCKAI